MKPTVHYVKPLSVALLTALSISFSGSVFAVAGKFQFVNGEVQVINAAGAQHKVQKGDSIDEGDTVASAADGFAQIKMEDGGFFAVRPDTQFKVDTFQFNGKTDGSEQGVFSLIKGSLRSVTGLIGKVHRDNYKINTATSVIGIRGSGADVGHSDAIGTAVRTLFGGHSLTSGGKTVVTGPGQVALAPPGEAPKIVPNFPFNTSTSAAGGGNGNGEKSSGSEKASGGESEKTDQEPTETAAPEKVIIPIKDTSGNNFTNPEIVTTAHPAVGNYGHEVIGPYPLSGGGYSIYNPYSDSEPNTSYLFDSNNNLVEVNAVFGSSIYTSTAKFSGGVAKETYKSSDGGVYLGRWVGGSATNTYTGGYPGESNNSSTVNFGPGSLHWLVSVNPASGLVQSLSGTSNYSLVAKTSPTDALGNVGHLLDTSSLTADFTNQKVNLSLFVNFETGNSVYVSSQNKSFAVTTGQGISISGNHAWGSGSVACTGADCSTSGYYSSLWARFAGADASYNALAYNISGGASDLVQGVAAFKTATNSSNYMHYISAIRPAFTGSGFIVAEQNTVGWSGPISNYVLNSDGLPIQITNSELSVFDAGGVFPNVNGIPSGLVVSGGTTTDAYHSPDNSVYISRGSNIVVTTTCAVCSGTDNFVSTHEVLAKATAPAFVQTLTGSTSYTLAGNTHPTDALGNVGTLNSAYLNANFTSQAASFGLNVGIANKTLDASAVNIPIVIDSFNANTAAGNLAATCTGTGCTGVWSGVKADIGGGFVGYSAATAVMGYHFTPSGDVSGNFTDYVHGLAVLTAGSAPTATPSVAGTVGGGGAAVGILSAGTFNDFNVVDNTKFAVRQDLASNVIAWNKQSSNYGDFSFSAGTGSVLQDGTDAANGVIWGRWGSYIATNHSNGVSSNLGANGGLSLIAASHITTVAELASYASFTGSGLSAGNTIGTYSLALGNFPTGVNGVASGTLTSASATVNFSTSQITALSVAGSGGAFGNWSATGAGSIADFMAKSGATGISLSGTCGGGSGACGTSASGSVSISGTAVGGLVGAQAQGLISTIGLTAGSDKLGGAVYMKR